MYIIYYMRYTTGVLAVKTNPLQFGLQFQICFFLQCFQLLQLVKSLINKSTEAFMLFSGSFQRGSLVRYGGGLRTNDVNKMCDI